MGLRRAAHVAWRRVGDETVLIHLKTKKIYVLNPSGGFFWHSLDGAQESREFLDGLSLEEPLPGDAAKQLDGFFDQLKNTDLVEVHTSSDRSSEDSKGGNGYPLPSFVAPEMVWEEQLRNFGQSCARDPGQMPTCDVVPTF
ncbi:MAG: hypothetical protein BMS9Abin37_2709 [Acidobacteriota bacterium]|nr:MAG: hypothetical protein BMS9Abin37_2709 [Acidobacteriota bacterium]